MALHQMHLLFIFQCNISTYDLCAPHLEGPVPFPPVLQQAQLQGSSLERGMLRALHRAQLSKAGSPAHVGEQQAQVEALPCCWAGQIHPPHRLGALPLARLPYLALRLPGVPLTHILVGVCRCCCARCSGCLCCLCCCYGLQRAWPTPTCCCSCCCRCCCVGCMHGCILRSSAQAEVEVKVGGELGAGEGLVSNGGRGSVGCKADQLLALQVHRQPHHIGGRLV